MGLVPTQRERIVLTWAAFSALVTSFAFVGCSLALDTQHIEGQPLNTSILLAIAAALGLYRFMTGLSHGSLPSLCWSLLITLPQNPALLLFVLLLLGLAITWGLWFWLIGAGLYLIWIVMNYYLAWLVFGAICLFLDLFMAVFLHRQLNSDNQAR